jgi:hypothetical protein
VATRELLRKRGIDLAAGLGVALGVAHHVRRDPPVLLRAPAPVPGVVDDLE